MSMWKENVTYHAAIVAVITHLEDCKPLEPKTPEEEPTIAVPAVLLDCVHVLLHQYAVGCQQVMDKLAKQSAATYGPNSETPPT